MYKEQDVLNFKEFVNLSGLTQAEIARILNTSPVSISRRYNNAKSEPTYNEVIKVEKAIKRRIIGKDIPLGADAVEIKYYYDEKLANLIKIPEITSVWLDRELVHNVWRKNENNLKCLAMPGDSMRGGNVPLLDGDILIIDTSMTDIRRSGIYAYTTHDDKFIGVNQIILKPDMQVKFDFWNEKRQSLIYSPEQFKELKFKPLGKAIRSLSIYRD